jgi:hypothetical protein
MGTIAVTRLEQLPLAQCMNKTSYFPNWLPSPRSWVMAIKLVIPAYVGATVIFAFEFWRYSLVGGLLAITHGSDSMFFFMISGGALILAFAWFLVLVGIYALLLKLLWSKPPKWLCLPKFGTLIIRDFGILVLSIFPIAVLFALYVLLIRNPEETFTNLGTPRITYDVFLLRFSWLWTVAAAYLYQWFTRRNLVNSQH